MSKRTRSQVNEACLPTVREDGDDEEVGADPRFVFQRTDRALLP